MRMFQKTCQAPLSTDFNCTQPIHKFFGYEHQHRMCFYVVKPQAAWQLRIKIKPLSITKMLKLKEV